MEQHGVALRVQRGRRVDDDDLLRQLRLAAVLLVGVAVEVEVVQQADERRARGRRQARVDHGRHEEAVAPLLLDDARDLVAPRAHHLGQGAHLLDEVARELLLPREARAERLVAPRGRVDLVVGAADNVAAEGVARRVVLLETPEQVAELDPRAAAAVGDDGEAEDHAAAGAAHADAARAPEEVGRPRLPGAAVGRARPRRVGPGEARAELRFAEERRRRGPGRGPLHGRPRREPAVAALADPQQERAALGRGLARPARARRVDEAEPRGAELLVRLDAPAAAGADGPQEAQQVRARALRLDERREVVDDARLCRNQIFNTTSMCAYATVSTQGFRLCFENLMIAIDSFKNQLNRLRFDRAREF